MDYVQKKWDKSKFFFDNIWKLTCACGKTRVLQAQKKRKTDVCA